MWTYLKQSFLSITIIIPNRKSTHQEGQCPHKNRKGETFKKIPDKVGSSTKGRKFGIRQERDDSWKWRAQKTQVGTSYSSRGPLVPLGLVSFGSHF